jgi:hypothetical protein
MKLVGSFLSRFQKITPPNDALRRAVAKAASIVLGTEITKEKVTIRAQTAFIDVPSVQKHKIRIERQELLSLVHESLPNGRNLVRDVR